MQMNWRVQVGSTNSDEEVLPSPAHKAHTVLSNHRDAVPGRRLPGIGYG
jgi:hypothetical protein